MYYFSLARTALKVGIKSYGYNSNKVVLIPNFLCDSVTISLCEENIHIVTYDLFDNLQPNWDELNSLCNKFDVFAVLMVHYFGQPQLIEKFQYLCNRYQILLIEDNAHGYGGKYNGKDLGTYGDIGIASPRKFLNLSYGGKLYLKESSLKISNANINIHPFLRFSLNDKLKKIIRYFPKFSSFLKNVKFSRINFSDPYCFHEGIQEDRYLCESDINLINTVNWDEISFQRRKLWVEWEKFSRSHGLSPVFDEIWPESNPWCYPVYTDNINQRNEWINWGIKNKVHLFPWPSLPSLQIEKKTLAFRKWERILCFPLDSLSPWELCDAAKSTTI